MKKQGAKVFCLRRGKGQKKEYYLEIKRNLIEKSLDELCVSDISELRGKIIVIFQEIINPNPNMSKWKRKLYGKIVERLIIIKELYL